MGIVTLCCDYCGAAFGAVLKAPEPYECSFCHVGEVRPRPPPRLPFAPGGRYWVDETTQRNQDIFR